MTTTRNSPRRSLTLALLVLLPGVAGAGPEEDRARLARQILGARGDATRGRALFANSDLTGCVRCHRVGNEGSDIGPDLSDIGGKFGREHLVESLLDPSRQIVEGYRTTILALRDGRVLTGLVKDEKAGELTLVEAETRRTVVRKEDIEGRRFSDVSIMPEGLAAKLSPAQLADLVAYLEGLRSSAKPTPGSQLDGPVALPAGFSMTKVAGGLTGATALAVSPDGRVFVCEQTGALRVIKAGSLLPEPFVALDVDTRWERGLVGVCLDPRFPEVGHVYVNHVKERPFPHHRISRITAQGDRAAPGSEVVLFEGDDQRRLGGSTPAGHQGGALHFGADGKLYVAIGDQTAGEPAQRLDTLQGKLLRLNADGTIPADNPFLDRTRGKYRAIWATGLRNPFTFAVQPRTGRIFINDVGQNAWEEVNEGFAGANYGWPAAEGASRDPAYRPPIHTYRVASVAGGAFCPESGESGFPSNYLGKYFFMDFVKGWIRVLDPDRPADAAPFATGLTRPVDLAFAPGGGLYVLLRDAWVIDDKFRPHTGSLQLVRYGISAPGG